MSRVIASRAWSPNDGRAKLRRELIASVIRLSFTKDEIEAGFSEELSVQSARSKTCRRRLFRIPKHIKYSADVTVRRREVSPHHCSAHNTCSVMRGGRLLACGDVCPVLGQRHNVLSASRRHSRVISVDAAACRVPVGAGRINVSPAFTAMV